MSYTEPDLENALLHLNKLDENAQPNWGEMSAHRMVEHLTDTLNLAMGNLEKFPLQIPEDKIEKAQAFLFSEHPLPKNFEASFAKKAVPTRTESISDAIDEFATTWVDFQDFFDADPNRTTFHPSFGELNYEKWLRLHSKHLTHHFQQFGLIEA